MSRSLRAAVIGLGWAGTVHARALAHMDGVNLVAVADTDPVRRVAYPAQRQAIDVNELLTLDLDYCVVATPTATHEEVGLTLADAGINALIEKPLAPTLEASLRLVDAFDRRALIAAVGHTERRNPAIGELAARLRTGEFGTLYALATRRHSPFPDRIRDVGVVTDIGIHDVDLVAYLTGRHITSVAARTAHISGRAHEDLATATCVLDGAGLATIELSRIAPLKERLVTVYTAAGRVSVDALTCTITHHTNASLQAGERADRFPGMTTGPIISRHIDGPEPFYAQNAAFRDALQGRPHDIVTLREGAAAVAATEAILTAARTNASTPVPAPVPTALPGPQAASHDAPAAAFTSRTSLEGSPL
ncbi:Gfo/Idh/MocA family oxidoreductase [Streptosporangium sp. NPDC002524]|uniref:Gfo/Idh/MocA family protein n=1 Tax=Streptosporangium sp. NPDC002524 TaxID=3154537 RepID=UPI00332C1A20